MRKRLVILALICVLTASLPACGSQETSSTITIDEKVDESVALSMFVPVGVDLGGTDSFRDLTLAYNKQDSKIRITVDSVSTADGFDDFLEKRLDTKDAVDIFVVNAENVKDIAQKGQFYDLSGLKSFHELTKSAKEQAMVGDIAYSIPLKMAVYVMDVNVSLLKQYDLEVPENYEDFLHCCQVLKKQNITPISLNRW
ncbi:ABC transporter substrate-binding protein [Hominibacterium faecale]|nr:extracellular solute-binding protein [Hominibacterium faecale]